MSTSVELTFEQVEDLMTSTKYFNNTNFIRGILIYVDGFFFQIIQGEEMLILPLYKRIEEDSRHFNIYKIFEGVVNDESFYRFNCKYITYNESKITANLLSFLELDVENDSELHDLFVKKSKTLMEAF